MSEAYFSYTSLSIYIFFFAGDLAAVRIIAPECS